ncbi:MAG: TonB-dependent receptor [Bacteroidales bacterium]|nr:TonB-dependent receptor [Bacteroidales bacterium]
MKTLFQKAGILILLLTCTLSAYSSPKAKITGKVITPDQKAVDYATVYLKDTEYGSSTNSEGIYLINAPEGKYTLVVSSIGYKKIETPVVLTIGKEEILDLELTPLETNLKEVVVQTNAVKQVKESAFNVIAIDAKSLHNTTLDLAGTLAKVPGVKLREAGGVGSDMRFSLDGFSGKHVKFFIDGVPQEGVGASFGINNIPINYADRIEVYRGVVPVGFGADAIGGVVNIVTAGKGQRTFVDASYSFGSFNTHRSYVNVGHTTKQGLFFELNAYQNYSDNNYWIHTPVKDLETGAISKSTIEKVKRFHDNYHNETVIFKVGLVGKSFADRLMLGINLSQYDKEIQNGVRQEIVFGEKSRNGYSIMPSLVYKKRNLFTDGLNVTLTANYNRNMTHNVDTSAYSFNWRGESIYNNGSLGEQSYQNSKNDADNWNTTFNAQYWLSEMHSFTLNHVLTANNRSTRGNSETSSHTSTYDKTSRKNITGLSYLFNYNQIWNVSAFGKYYNQYNNGPRRESASSYNYILFSEEVGNWGYGVAGTYFFLKDFQAKLSYEKAYRLPTSEELFGDDDMELGAVGLKPESSNNMNVNLSYSKTINNNHSIYIEGAFLYRYTKDYIRRTTDSYSGGKYYASHENYGKVRTVGFSSEVRYNYSNKLSIGGNITSQNIRDDEEFDANQSQKINEAYKARIPNIPYFFSNMDASYYFHDFMGKGNILTITYGNLYVHEFPLFIEKNGDKETKMRVPDQFSHDISLTYSVKNGRYNFSLECRNFTDERLYDNFSLEKPGRAFYGKVRYFFGR